jgi:hypothetical protein
MRSVRVCTSVDAAWRPPLGCSSPGFQEQQQTLAEWDVLEDAPLSDDSPVVWIHAVDEENQVWYGRFTSAPGREILQNMTMATQGRLLPWYAYTLSAVVFVACILGISSYTQYRRRRKQAVYFAMRLEGDSLDADKYVFKDEPKRSSGIWDSRQSVFDYVMGRDVREYGSGVEHIQKTKFY